MDSQVGGGEELDELGVLILAFGLLSDNVGRRNDWVDDLYAKKREAEPRISCRRL